MISLITRADDCGSTKGANEAIINGIKASFIKNISFMAVGDYIEEAAQQLKNRKDICFGLHFTINSEWDTIKWKPVSKKYDINTLLTEHGEFYSSPNLYKAQNSKVQKSSQEDYNKNKIVPDISQIKKEWNGQLDKLIKLGLDISYADTHMFPELYIDGLAEEMSQWIKEKGLIDHRYFYRVLPYMDELSKTEGLFEAIIKNLQGSQYFYLSHPAAITEDMLLCGNKLISGKQLANERKKDYDFIKADTTIKLCEKYQIKTIRYDEAKLEPKRKHSLKEWIQVEG